MAATYSTTTKSIIYGGTPQSNADELDNDFNYFVSTNQLNKIVINTNKINQDQQISYYDYYSFGNDYGNENEIILDGETQIRFLGNIKVWQLAATFLLGCVSLS
jgi:hypothetical protein